MLRLFRCWNLLTGVIGKRDSRKSGHPKQATIGKVVCTSLLIGFLWMTAGADTLTVQGTVRSTATGAPVISGAIVSAKVGTLTIKDTTNALGFYKIQTLVTGVTTSIVIVSATATGFMYSRTTIKRIPGTNNNVPDTAAIDISMQPAGDSLIIKGRIINPAATGINGAIVTALGVSGTTDTQGNYSIKVLNLSYYGSVYFSIAVRATGGYIDTAKSHFNNIANPNDGIPDTVTQNIVMFIPVMDTVTVTGVIKDSISNLALSSARVNVRLSSKYGNINTTVLDTQITSSTGTFAFKIPIYKGSTDPHVFLTAENNGYILKGKRVNPTNDHVFNDTLKLVAYTAADSVHYIVNGHVTNERQIPLGGVRIVVNFAIGTTVLKDTLTTYEVKDLSEISYTVNHWIPYQAGNLVVTVEASYSGYQTFTTSTTVPTSVGFQKINIALTPLNSTIATPKVLHAISGQNLVTIFSLNGKMLGSFMHVGELTAADLPRQFRVHGQAVVVRITDGTTRKSRMIVTGK